MPIAIPWGSDFSSQLRIAVENPAPATESPIVLRAPDSFQIGNRAALQFLDSRQRDSEGKLPKHVCAPAHAAWERVEKNLESLLSQMERSPEDTAEFQLLQNYLVAWTCMVRLNIGNLSLVDSTTPYVMRVLAPGYIEKVRSSLEAMRPYEGDLEDALNGPVSPTRLLRNTVDHAMA